MRSTVQIVDTHSREYESNQISHIDSDMIVSTEHVPATNPDEVQCHSSLKTVVANGDIESITVYSNLDSIDVTKYDTLIDALKDINKK